MRKKITINFILPAWGDVYIFNAIHYALKSLLTKKNKKFIQSVNSNLIFCTRKIDKKLIIDNPFYKTLSENFIIKFVFIDDLLIKEKKRRILTYIYYRGMKYDYKKENINFLLCADDFYVDGSILIIKKYFNQKSFCIFDNQLFVDERIKENKLFKNFYNKPLAIEDALFLLYKYLHLYSKLSVIKNNLICNLNPFFFLVEIKKNIFVKNQIICHPRVVKTLKKIKSPKCFLDYSFAIENVNKNNFYYTNNIKKYFSFSLVNKNDPGYNVKKKKLYTIDQYMFYLSKFCTKEHLLHINKLSLLSKNNISKKIIKKKLFTINNKIYKFLSKNVNDYKFHPYWGTNYKLNFIKKKIYQIKKLFYES